MNALAGEIPYASNLICIWHYAAIRGGLKWAGLPDGMVTHIYSLWFAIANAESQDAYDEDIAVLRKEAPARFVDYVEQTWLPYALKFVAFHTNKHFHLGQRTSSRVEGAHA